MTSQYNISLDIQRGGYQAELDGFVVGDTKTRVIAIKLIDGGRPFNIPDGCTATIWVQTPSGTSVFGSCTIINGIITHTVMTTELTAAGEARCQCRIMNSEGSIISSPKFKLTVAASLYDDDAAEASDEYSALTEALTEVQDVTTGLPSKIGKVAGATPGNVPVFDEDGSVVDDGYSFEDYAKVYDIYWVWPDTSIIEILSMLGEESGCFSAYLNISNVSYPATCKFTGNTVIVTAVVGDKTYSLNYNGTTLTKSTESIYDNELSATSENAPQNKVVKVAIEAHTSNTIAHVTLAEKNSWNGKVSESELEALEEDISDNLSKYARAYVIVYTTAGVPENIVALNALRSATDKVCAFIKYNSEIIPAIIENGRAATAITVSAISKGNADASRTKISIATTNGIDISYTTETLYSQSVAEDDLSAPTGGAVKAYVDGAVAGKQDKLTAGDNITIGPDGTISATGGGESYTAGAGISITNGVISVSYPDGEELTY